MALAVRSRQISVNVSAVLAGMITRVTEDELAFGGYGMYVTGVHQPASSDDIRYISALITMEIVHAVERYVNDNTALQHEEHNAVMVVSQIRCKR